MSNRKDMVRLVDACGAIEVNHASGRNDFSSQVICMCRIIANYHMVRHTSLHNNNCLDIYNFINIE